MVRVMGTRMRRITRVFADFSILGVMGTRMTRMTRVFTDFFNVFTHDWNADNADNAGFSRIFFDSTRSYNFFLALSTHGKTAKTLRIGCF